MKKNEIIIYTDGSSLGNPGPGGWGVVLLFADTKVIELGGREKESTNNRMEMMAALEALRLISMKKPNTPKIIIHTDSSYLLNGITMWVYAWVKNNWQTKNKEPVLNKDLWEELFKLSYNLSRKYEIEWVKVAGHAGVLLNERCDEIATGFSAGERVLLFTGNLKNYEKIMGRVFKETKKQAEIKKVSKAKKGKDAYAYVSLVDGKIFSDQTWVECEKRVKGKSGAKYKKVYSKTEEQELIALWSLKSLF